MASGLYLESESDSHHIIFCDTGYRAGDDSLSEKAFIHIKSKNSRIVFPYIKVEDLIEIDASYIKDFFREANSITDSKALDNHLSRFIPFSNVKKDSFAGFSKYSHGTPLMKGGASPLSLVDVVSKFFDKKGPYKDWMGMKNWLESNELSSRGGKNKENLIKIIDNKLRNHKIIGDSAFNDYGVGDTTFYEIMSGLSTTSLFSANESTQEFRSLLSGVLFNNRDAAHRNQVWASVAAPHLADDLPSDHPARDGLYRMAFGDNPHLSKEEVFSSGILNGNLDYGGTPDNLEITSSSLLNPRSLVQRGNASKVINFMMGDNDIEQRNIFQTLRSFDFDSGLFQGRACSHKELDHYKEDIASGMNPSKLLHKITRDYLYQGDSPYYQMGKEKFGKRDFNIISHNIVAQNRLMYGGKSAKFITLEGETLVATPYSRLEIMEKYKEWGGDGKMRESGKMAVVTLKDKEGNAVFSGLMNCEKFNQGMGLIIADMPKGILTKASHLRALETLADNAPFKKKLSAGFMMLRDGALNKASEYRGVWESIVAGVDRALDGNEPYAASIRTLRESKALQRYESSTYIQDGQWIMNTLSTAIGMHYLRNEGVPLESKFRDLDDLSEEMSGNDLEFMVDGDVFDAEDGISRHKLISPFSLRCPGINHAVTTSDKLHKGYSSLIAEAGPNIEASWPACLPDISIDLPSGKTATIKPITSYMDVRREGREQDHCLGSYGTRCLRREYEAFQVFVDGKHEATLGMECDGDTLYFDQLQGYGNSAVSPELDAAIRDFAEALENEGEYEGHEVTIEPADNEDLRLGNDDLISLQVDVDVSSKASIDKCTEFLVEKIGEEATRDLVISSIQGMMSHYEEKHMNEINEWEMEYSDCDDVDPPDTPYEYDLVERAKREFERSWSLYHRSEMVMES